MHIRRPSLLFTSLFSFLFLISSCNNISSSRGPLVHFTMRDFAMESTTNEDWIHNTRVSLFIVLFVLSSMLCKVNLVNGCVCVCVRVRSLSVSRYPVHSAP